MSKNYQNDCCNSKASSKCGSVVAKTLPEYSNVPIAPPPPPMMKVPIDLAKIQVQIDLESVIELDVPALEIKRIKKNLFLTQCKIILDPPDECHVIREGKLFLGGYIRKNIEYATAECISKDALSGDIRHTTVKVPFECATRVRFPQPVPPNIPPVFTQNSPMIEFDTLNCKETGTDIHEKTFRNIEVFNEKIYCELIEARFDQIDIQECGEPIECHHGEALFKNIREKTALYITLKLLQKQQVRVPIYYKEDC